MSARPVGGRAADGGKREAGHGEWRVPADGQVAEALRASLRAFLAGFGIGPEPGHLVERLLPGAYARWHADPEQNPVDCGLLHAEETFEAWLSAVLGAEKLGGQPALPVGRAAFLACGGPTTWPHLVLVEDALPEAFVTAMRAAAPVLAPMPMPGPMATQSLERWSIAEAGRALGEVLDANVGWLPQARPLLTAPIKLGRSDS